MKKNKYSGATYCAAINCCKNSVSNKELSFFSFPKDPLRCKQWIQNTRRPDLQTTNGIRNKKWLCSDHFEDLMFSNDKKNRLKKTAVPTIFDIVNPPPTIGVKRKPPPLRQEQPVKVPKTSTQSNSSRSPQTSPRGKLSSSPVVNGLVNSFLSVASIISSTVFPQQLEEFPQEVDHTETVIEEPAHSTPQPCSVSTKSDNSRKEICTSTVSSSCQTGPALSRATPRKVKLRKKGTILTRKLHYTSTKLKEARKSNAVPKTTKTLSYFLELCNHFLPKKIAPIVQEQAKLHAARKPKGYRYSMPFKQFALTLYYMSPKAYRYLKSILLLPTARCLRGMTQLWKIEPGFNQNVFNVLESRVAGLSRKDRMCTLTADEMSLKSHLFYDISSDSIVGLEDLGKGKTYKPVTHALVLMASGITSNWKQPVAYFLAHSGVSGYDVKNILQDYVKKLDGIGFNVKTVVSDMGANFIQASKLLGVKKTDPFFYVGNKKIFYLFDVPHIMKCVRNNLMKYDFKFNGKTARWKDIVDFYEADKKYPLRLAPKLTDNHLRPNNFQKMKVRFATQVISGTVAACLHTYAKLGRMTAGAIETAEFLDLFDKLFDLLNSSSFKAKKKFNRAFKGTTEQVQFLYKMLRLLDEMRLVCRITGEDCTSLVNFINCYQITIRGVLDLWSSCKEEQVEYFFTRYLNQDCLENFFSFLRSQGGNSRNPTSIQFKRAFRKAFCLNFFQKAEGSNCAADLNETLSVIDESNAKPPIDKTPRTTLDTGSKPAILLIPTITSSDYNALEIPYANATRYVSGYLVHKCLKVHSCEVCQSFSKSNVDDTPTTTFCSVKAYETADQVPFGKLKMPPEEFIEYTETLEKTFIQNFGRVALSSPATELYSMMQPFEFQHPCQTFPQVYLLKLFIRLRIFHVLTEVNRKLAKPGTANSEKKAILQNI